MSLRRTPITMWQFRVSFKDCDVNFCESIASHHYNFWNCNFSVWTCVKLSLFTVNLCWIVSPVRKHPRLLLSSGTSQMETFSPPQSHQTNPDGDNLTTQPNPGSIPLKISKLHIWFPLHQITTNQPPQPPLFQYDTSYGYAGLFYQRGFTLEGCF